MMKARLALLLSAASAVCSPFSIEVESSKSLLLPLPLSQIGSGHYNALCRPGVMMKTKLETF